MIRIVDMSTIPADAGNAQGEKGADLTSRECLFCRGSLKKLSPIFPPPDLKSRVIICECPQGHSVHHSCAFFWKTSYCLSCPSHETREFRVVAG